MKPYHETEHGVLYHGDCLDILPMLADKSVDLVLTDPPYGIGADKGYSVPEKNRFGVCNQYDGDWDGERPPQEIFDLILSLNKPTVMFGGNYFTDMLPQANHWGVWDKKITMPTFSGAELIWTNIKRNSVKVFRYAFNGLENRETRYHPTQKPFNLIGMVLNEYSKENDLILDPFAGSGTTAIACIRYKRRYIMIEKEEKYCEICVKRIESELQQTEIEL